MSCPFCDRLATGAVLASNDLAAAFADGFPISPAHALIVPRRHEADFLSLTDAEQAAIWALVPAVRQRLEAARTPDGYNIGVNVGEPPARRCSTRTCTSSRATRATWRTRAAVPAPEPGDNFEE